MQMRLPAVPRFPSGSALRKASRTLGFVRDVWFRFGLRGKDPSPATERVDAEWLRRRLEAMGPTYVKIGQFVSSRRDIFDPAVVQALRGLQDDVSPIPASQVRDVIGGSFGSLGSFDGLEGFGAAPAGGWPSPPPPAGALAGVPGRVRHMVKGLDPVPVASASLGQVHVGHIGRTKVVVKVKRPGVASALEEDMALLLGLLSLMQALGVTNVAESRELVEGFREFVLLESDYECEVQNLRAFASTAAAAAAAAAAPASANQKQKQKPLGGRAGVIVPRVYAPLCSGDVIVMEHVASVKFKDAMPRLSAAQRSALAYSLMNLFVRHMLQDGLLHGDPHEGNIALSPDLRSFVFYDFGNVIRIEPRMRLQLKCLVFELLTNNVDATIAILRAMPHVSVRDETGLRAYIALYARYMKTVDVEVFKVASLDDRELYSKLPVKFDTIIFRIIRVFGLVEGICKELDPAFNYSDIYKFTDGMLFDAQFMEHKLHADTRRLLAGVIALLPDLPST
jgi:ubiquinone biosynthesis protein